VDPAAAGTVRARPSRGKSSPRLDASEAGGAANEDYGPRRLIYVDSAYTTRIVRDRGHEDYWLARHSWGYFDEVWGVHPAADVPDGEDRYRARVARFSRRQIVIEGTSRVLRLPKWLLAPNFILSQLLLLRGILKHARRWPVAAVFANDPLYCGLFGLVLARRLKVPLIVFIPAHYDELYEATGALANPRLFRFRKVEQAVMRRVLGSADMVFAAAESLARLALKYGASESAVARLKHGKYLASCHLLDPAERRPAGPALQRYGIPDAPQYLIYVGRHTGVKHPGDALKAMSIVLSAEPEAVGIMAGVGELTDSLRDEADSLGVGKRVVFPGLVDQQSLSLILPRCVTFSPLTGMALVESALAGSPIVAYDRDWQSEFIANGVNGCLVQYRDWQAMGEEALRIIRAPDLGDALSRAARTSAMKFVDPEGSRAREHEAFDAMFERFRKRSKQARPVRWRKRSA
jgi:glycosyltransferase involved in cell wall biosynthesis